MLKGKAAFTDEPGDYSPPISSTKRITSGTQQQEAFWESLVDGQTHILAEARAGCGKSSSCREGMWRVLDRFPGHIIRYAVFNKANADEFRQHCPPQVAVGTSHSFGYGALQKAFCSRVEKNKTYLILDESPSGRNLPRYLRKSISMLVGQAKNQMLRPKEDENIDKELERLILHYDIKTYGRSGLIVSWALNVLSRSAEWVELVDFDDMLWLPALFRVPFPYCDILFLDECQDFNPAQHALVSLMAQSGRVVAVGDRFQAINAFRGADMDSIPNLSAALEQTDRQLFTFPLTITFRCPMSHVRLANAFVPDLTADSAAPVGEVVSNMTIEQMILECERGDLVICPTNAPVIRACLKLIDERKPAYVRGRAVGDQLVTILRGLPRAKTVGELSRGVEAWRSRELNRLALLDGVEDVIESVEDRANGLQAVLASCDSPADAEPLIGQIFSDTKKEGVVTFSTVHRAKGDEAHVVWFLDAPLPAPTREWQQRQHANLRYVALTRSKYSLRFVNVPKN